MKELTDENFREIFSPVTKGGGFITDASRRQVIALLKKQNFLAFNPLQFNIFYLAAVSVIVLSAVAALISNNMNAEDSAKADKPDFHTLKREVPVHKAEAAPAKPVVADTAVAKLTDTAAAKTPAAKPDTAVSVHVVKNNNEVAAAKKLLADLEIVPQGLPVLFVKPSIAPLQPKMFLPKMPDSLPPPIKLLVRKPKPLQALSGSDTGRTTGQPHRPDSSPAAAPVTAPVQDTPAAPPAPQN